MRNDKQNIIVEISFDFSLRIIQYTALLQEQKKFQLANQLFKSGTSIGANVREAQNAQSKMDFLHKMKVAAKEADETQYWLLLCEHSELYPSPDIELVRSIESIIKVLSKIISTTKSY